MNTGVSSEAFDKKFIIAATAIGMVYALLIVTLGATIGKEAAGVAGVALTALATGIFKQFETLRFRQMSQEEQFEVPIPKISLYKLIVFSNCFLGLKVFFGLMIGTFLASANLAPEISGMESFIELISNWKIVGMLIGMNSVIYILGGFLIGKAFEIRTYSTLVMASLASCMIDGLLPLIPMAINNFSGFIELLSSGALWPASFWLIFIAATLFGAKLAAKPIVVRA